MPTRLCCVPSDFLKKAWSSVKLAHSPQGGGSRLPRYGAMTPVRLSLSVKDGLSSSIMLTGTLSSAPGLLATTSSAAA